MRGHELLGYFEHLNGTWVCTKSVMIELPDGGMQINRGMMIREDSWLSEMLDKLSAEKA